ncbi:MAG: VOC family protein [Nitrospirota bacterium]|nr:VOC family protein [Nitrospirota bacterium]
MITRMAFVAQPTRNMAAAKRFYGEVLGLKADFAAPHGKWAEFVTPDGATVALDAFSPEISDKARAYLSLESDDIVADVARLKAAGATVARDTWTNRDTAGGEICHMAVLKDPDDNSVVLHQIVPGRQGH